MSPTVGAARSGLPGRPASVGLALSGTTTLRFVTMYDGNIADRAPDGDDLSYFDIAGKP